jgi:hypothetical protein
VVRDEAWRSRRVRTEESFLELLTATPLKGFGEEPKKVEALLKDDPEALALFREAITSKRGKRAKDNSDIVTVKGDGRGNARGYTLTRLKRHHPTLYQRVVAGELSAHAAAREAGFRHQKASLDQLHHPWGKASPCAKDYQETQSARIPAAPV